MDRPTGRNEWLVYRHPAREGAIVSINPSWSAIWEGDAIFTLLCEDMGLTADELAALLAPHAN